MFDLVKLRLQAGDGGDGRVSFRREKYVPKGGPDGGNAGDGGSIYIRGSKHLNTLQHFAGVKEYAAQRGGNGGARRSEGGKGEDLILEVPVGTTIWLLAENVASRKRRIHTVKEGNLKPQAHHMRFSIPAMGGVPPAKPLDEVFPIDLERELNPDISKKSAVTSQEEAVLAEDLKSEGEAREDEAQESQDQEAQIIRSDSLKNFNIREVPKVKFAEITEDGQMVLLCQGGFGGRGNEMFKGSTNTTPLEAEYGTFGEKKIVLIELKLLADVGLIGFPNAGKSTLLSVVTKANPKIANYPFTTLEPNLGVMAVKEKSIQEDQADLVLADIPGLIEGASQGKGLGFDFLRHVYACKVLLYLLTLEEGIIFDDSITVQEKAEMVYEQYTVLRKELESYDAELIKKPYLLSLSKKDLYSEELLEAVTKQFETNNQSIFSFSVAANQGIDELKQLLFVKTR